MFDIRSVLLSHFASQQPGKEAVAFLGREMRRFFTLQPHNRDIVTSPTVEVLTHNPSHDNNSIARHTMQNH